MKNSRTIFEWLTENFRVIIRNDENFALKREFSFNYAKLLVLAVLFFALSSTFSICVYKQVEGYYDNQAKRERVVREQLMEIHLKVDTLEQELAKRDTFIRNLQQIVKD